MASSHEKLFTVYRGLMDSVTDERGYGGPVWHTAEVDGGSLYMSTSDFGDLAVSYVKESERYGESKYYAFEIGQNHKWYPITVDAKDEPEILDTIADLAQNADWQDRMIDRNSTDQDDLEM